LYSQLFRSKLVNNSKQLLVLYSNNKRVFGRSSNATIHVNEHCVPFLDLIVLGWIIELRDAGNGEKSEAAGEGGEGVALIANIASNVAGATART